MKQNGSASDIVLDFLVPARLASRYRVRLKALSPLSAELQLAFCPSIFRSGVLVSCPAELSLVLRDDALRLRGIFRVERGANDTTGRLQFSEAVMFRDLELLRRACRLDDDSGAYSDLRSPARQDGGFEESAETVVGRMMGAAASDVRPNWLLVNGQ